MKDLLIECRTALGLAKSMAERERYDTDVYTKRIEMIDKALRKLAVVGSCHCSRCGDKHHDCLNGKMCYVCDNVTQGN